MPSIAIPSAPIIRTCWISRSTQQRLEDLARQWDPLETGGVLAGYWNRETVVITQCIGPGEGAKHHSSTFVPDYAFHDSEIARLYAESHGDTVYLGDWHTHPSGAARLSPLDKRTLRSIAVAPEAKCPRPLMVLLAGSGEAWSTQVFTLGLEMRILPRRVIQAELRVF